MEGSGGTVTSESDVRFVRFVSRGEPTSDGAGVRLTRMLGTARLPMVDPFLLLDQIRSDNRADYIAGFPDHPHRGFETVTIMIDGAMRHSDNKGHAGVISAGGIQWMTAGSGIIHSEIPTIENGRLWGFQLWINLPADAKMTPPAYQEVGSDRIPRVMLDGASVRVLAGTHGSGTKGPVGSPTTDPLLLDLDVQPGALVEEHVPEGHAAILAIYQGALTIGPEPMTTEVHDPDLAVLANTGTRVRFRAGDKGARALLIAARPIGEPVARYGPFVMTTERELEQAFADYHGGRF